MEGSDETSAPTIDEIYADVDDGDNNRTPKPIFSGDQLDIEVYASCYTGRTKIMRLLFIANRCGEKNNTTMQLEALRLAYDEIKKGENTQLYREVVQKIDGRLGPGYDLDVAWAENVDRSAEHKKKELENELNTALTSRIKEVIRIRYNDLGDFYYAHGQLGNAFKSYKRTWDYYCTTAKQIIDACMSSILVSIEMGKFSNVTGYVSKLKTATKHRDLIAAAKLRCAAGLANLAAKEYKLAAQKFLETIPDLGSHYNEVIAPQDVAIYGGLCALATFDRTELKNKVIDNINFRDFLELVPEVRELIYDFYSSRYASCLDNLGKLKANLLLDIHLHDHVETLYDQIRHKALIQYTLPFVSIDLNMMANAFKTTVAELVKELEALITDNQIQARIDAHNKILYARHADKRNATFQRVLETGREFDCDVRNMLLRYKLLNHEYNSRAWMNFL